MIQPQQSNQPKEIQFNYTIGTTSDKNNDCLLQAAHKDRIGDVKKWLKEHGHSINFQSNTGITPLMLASHKASPKVFNMILEHSSQENIKKVDSTGRNALHYACASGDFKRVEQLYCVHKLEILKDSNGFCAAEYAGSSIEIHNLLRKVTQDYLDKEGFLLEQLAKKANYDLAKMQELSAEYGLRGNFRVTSIDEFQNRYGDSISKVSAQETAAFKKEAKASMNDARAEIIEHFISNPPESLEKAIGYVWQKYGFKASEASMQKFLDYANKKRLEKEKTTSSTLP